MGEWIRDREICGRETHVRVEGTNRAKYANRELHHIVYAFSFVHLNPLFPLVSGWIVSFTWAERITRQLLDALPLTDGSAVERRWVGTAAGAFLVTTATATVTH